jgi:multidrug efflux pump subunit AcrB
VRQAISEVRDRLPKEMNEPRIERLDYVPDTEITYTISSDMRSQMELATLAKEKLCKYMESLPSVGKAESYGGRWRQVNVDLDPVQLESYGITATEVNDQIRASNINLPAGQGDVGENEQSIRTLGSVNTIEKLKQMRISIPGNRWIELGALGTIIDGSSDQHHVFFSDGQQSVSMGLAHRNGKNVVDLEKDAEMGVEELKKRYPDVKFSRIRNEARQVKESCSATFEAMLLGAVLAVIIIFVFLKNWRAALIATFAMPLSVIPTFAFFKVADFTLNDMTLLGLALVIGILVDDAIVEIENIIRHINMGKSPFKAAIDAADEIGLAVFATTMAAIVVFLPVAFMGGISGLYFRPFGWTVAVAVFCSLLVARLITPVMAAYWLKPQKEKESNPKLAKFYASALSLALKNRFATVLLGSAIFGASIALFQALPTSLVSRTDNSFSWIQIELPPGSQIKSTVDVIKQLSAIILKRPEVQRVYGIAGNGDSNRGFMSVTLKPRNERKLSQDQFEAALRPEIAKIPGARIAFGGGWGSGRVQLLLTSSDSATLQKYAQELLKQIGQLSDFSDVQSNAQLAKPEITIEPDMAKAAEQGVTADSIARTAMMAMMGQTSGNIPYFDTGDDGAPIAVRLSPEARRNLSVISNLKIKGRDGKLVPLSSVATVRLGAGIGSIERFDRARQVTISAKFSSKISLSDALKMVHNLPAYKELPPSISDRPSGDVEDQQEVFGGFGYAIFTGVILIYGVLILLFRGFLQPFTIMMSLPLSLGGALLALWAMSKPIDMYALIGIIMLMGLVTKNAILLVEYCLVQMDKGVPRTQAIYEAGRTRMRPILMTTTAMIAGMLPIAVAFGAGSEARSPMAIAVVGGLFASTILTLVVVPVVFTYMDDFQNWLKSLMNWQAPEGSIHLQ